MVFARLRKRRLDAFGQRGSIVPDVAFPLDFPKVSAGDQILNP